MSIPTPQEVLANPQYYADKGKILTLMASGKKSIEVRGPISPKLIDEIRQSKWMIVRMGDNFEGGFFMVGQ
jgi:hypothetical protein